MSILHDPIENTHHANTLRRSLQDGSDLYLEAIFQIRNCVAFSLVGLDLRASRSVSNAHPNHTSKRCYLFERRLQFPSGTRRGR